jgi:hypothetical protein
MGCCVLLGTLTGCLSLGRHPKAVPPVIGEATQRVDLPAVGFKGVTLQVSSAMTASAPGTPLSEEAEEALQPLVAGRGSDAEISVFLGEPLGWSEGDRRIEIVPGFFTKLPPSPGTLHLDPGSTYPSFSLVPAYARSIQKTSPGFSALPRDQREQFLRYTFLNFAKKTMGERNWNYSVSTDVHRHTLLSVAGSLGSSFPDRAFALRWVLGRGTEFLVIIASGPADEAELATLADAIAASLDFFPDDPRKW